MRLMKLGTPFVLGALLIGACAAPAGEGGDGDGDVGTGGAVSGIGGSLAGIGGSVAGIGGSVAGIGGSVAGIGGSVAGVGGSVAGVGGSGPSAGCGSTTTFSPESGFTAWETQDGVTRTDLEAGTTWAGPVTVTIAASADDDPYVAVALSPWVMSGPRDCVDFSELTGIKFTLAGTATPVLFKVGVAAATDSSHPEVTATPGENDIAFSSLMPATWGLMPPYDATEVQKLVWATGDKTEGNTITVSNISFY